MKKTDTKKCKRALLTTLVLLVFLFICVFVYIFWGTAISDWCYVHTTQPDVCFEADELSLEIGRVYEPKLSGDARFLQLAVLSSSDTGVVDIDENGMLVAVGNGKCVITASVLEHTTTLRASVGGELPEEILSLLSDFAKGFAEPDAMLELLERAERCKSERELAYAQLLSCVLDYYRGNGDREKLLDAIKSCSADEATVLTAAAVAACCKELGENPVVISFIGDVTISRYNEAAGSIRFPYIYEQSGSFTYPFDKTMGVFANDTLTVANFECVLSDYYKHEDKQFYFRGDPEYAQILPQSYIEVANLENNHSRDYYNQGFKDTYSNLTEAGVSCFYTDNSLTVDFSETAGGKIAFIAYHKKHGAAFEEEFCVEIENAIRQYKEQEYCVVLNLHWGVEGSDEPAQWQFDCARRFIDCGADIIIGHHPHVLQGIEQYNGKYIVYSIGNFAFGGNAVTYSPETIILRVSFGKVDGEFTVAGISAIPCHITSTRTKWNDYQPMIVFGDEGELVIEKLLSLSALLPDGITNIDRPEL